MTKKVINLHWMKECIVLYQNLYYEGEYFQFFLWYWSILHAGVFFLHMRKVAVAGKGVGPDSGILSL